MEGLTAPSVPQVIKTIIEPKQITCEFEARRLTKADTGLWECRVSTTGGQDSRKVKVNIRGEESVVAGAGQARVSGGACQHGVAIPPLHLTGCLPSSPTVPADRFG